MQLKWTCTYLDGQLWEPNCKGVFYKNNSALIYCYRDGHDLACSSVSDTEVKRINLTNITTVDLPSQWVLTGKKSNLLMCRKDLCLNLDSLFVYAPIQEENVRDFIDRETKEIFNLYEREYVFGDFTIKHYGQSGYCCFRNEKEIWRFRGQGYLYTEMKLHSGKNIFFGTGGNGGCFYVIELCSGGIVADIKTKGTSQIVGIGSVRYVLMLGRMSRLVCVSLETGMILDEVGLQGVATQNSRLYMDGNIIYATTFEYKNGRPIRGVINCIRV